MINDLGYIDKPDSNIFMSGNYLCLDFEIDTSYGDMVTLCISKTKCF